MNFISANDYSSSIEAYKDAKAHPMLCDESTTIECNKEQYSEILEYASTDKDVDDYPFEEIPSNYCSIYGMAHRQIGDQVFTIHLKKIGV